MTSREECTCANLCPGHPCICIYDYDKEECQLLRLNSPSETKVTVKMALDRRVNLDMREASLGEAGKFLAEVADAQIYVPADRIDERRTLYLEEVSLETVVRELGVMAVVRP